MPLGSKTSVLFAYLICGALLLNQWSSNWLVCRIRVLARCVLRIMFRKYFWLKFANLIFDTRTEEKNWTQVNFLFWYTYRIWKEPIKKRYFCEHTTCCATSNNQTSNSNVEWKHDSFSAKSHLEYLHTACYNPPCNFC